MLVKCPECARDVSSMAPRCPGCGRPLSLEGQEAVKKKPKAATSHMGGWLSLAALAMGVLSPAFMAPLFALAALVFAAMEARNGSGRFAVVLVGLSLWQMGALAERFNRLGAALGVSTANDADKVALARYAGTSTAVPAGWQTTATEHCQTQWPSDYSMQQYCFKGQKDAVLAMEKGAPAGVGNDTFRVVRGKCASEWPRDFKMRAYCEAKQFDAYLSLVAVSPQASKRNVCAQKWPDDFQMRRHCESKGD